MNRQTFKNVFLKLKNYYKNDYEKIKYEKKMVIYINITDDIKDYLGKEKKSKIEKILEENIFIAEEFEEVEFNKQYKTSHKMWVELNYATVEKLLELMKKRQEFGKNRIINAILDNYFKNKEVTIIDYKKERKE